MSEYLTQEKKAELEKELNDRKTITRADILERVSYAKSLGDLSENAEYHTSRDDQRKNEERIQKIESVLKTAVIVEKDASLDIVQLSSCVTVKKTNADNPQEFCIVGPEEADMAIGKISFTSPLGNALVGKKVGESFTFTTPKGDVAYTILDIK